MIVLQEGKHPLSHREKPTFAAPISMESPPVVQISEEQFIMLERVDKDHICSSTSK